MSGARFNRTQRKRWALSTGAALLVLVALTSSAQVVENTLTDQLRRVFPEINRGYIDLNGNGSLDQTDDLNELVPESTLTDARVQGTEILDFALDNVVFLSLEDLQGVQQAVHDAAGVIPELISIRYGVRLMEVIAIKEDQLARGVFSPVALREAHARVNELMTALTTAYKRQGRQDERDFSAARDGLLVVVAQGFPLPDGIADDDRDIMVTLMMHTVQGGNGAAPSATGATVEQRRSAVRALGELQAEESVATLISLLRVDEDLPAALEMKVASIDALGHIGSRQAMTVLLDAYRDNPAGATAPAALRATGRVGGPEAVSLVSDAPRNTLPNDGPGAPSNTATTEAALEAAVSLTSGTRPDRAFLPIFQAYTESPIPGLRRLAVTGLGAYRTRTISDLLVRMVSREREPEVRLSLIDAIAGSGQQNAPTFTALLRAADTEDEERIAVLEAVAGSPSNAALLPSIYRAARLA